MSDDLTRCPCCEGEGYFYGDDKPPNPWGDADELARLRAEVERLTAALSDERAHADALAEALGRCLRFMENTENELAITLESSEQGRAVIAQHRARRQG